MKAHLGMPMDKGEMMVRKIVVVAVASLCLILFASYANEGKLMKIPVDGGILYGRLLTGEHDRVAILVAGSGPTDMNGNSELIRGENDSFLQLAKKLNSTGTATFRYDKRSAGKSKTSFDGSEEVIIGDFVDDLVSVIDEMKAKGYEEVVLLGHSQGSLISILAAQQRDVQAVISIAGSGRSIDQNLIEQYMENESLYEDHIHVIETLRDGVVVPEAEKVDAMFAVEKQRFLIDWMRYDPAKEIAELDVPVLIIQGGEDLQTSLVDSSLLFMGVDQGVLTIVQDMNHVLKEVKGKSENIHSYQDPSYRLSPVLVDEITDFLLDDKR